MGRSITIESSDGLRRAEVTNDKELLIAGQVLNDILNAIIDSSGGYLEKILDNLQPGNTATTIYSLPANKLATIKTILICNSGITDAVYSIFVSKNNSIYNQANAIHYQVPILIGESKQIDILLYFDIENGSIGVQSDSNDVTFTISGEAKSI